METLIFIVASYLGTIAFALSGLLLGIRHELDIMGLFIMAILTANGGGAIRDILIGRTPSVLTDITAFYTVCAIFIIAIILKVNSCNRLERRFLFILCDAIGLAAFSITGALIGIDAELSAFGVMVLAFVTAVGGGVIRDTLLNEVPEMLHSGFYGSVALLIAIALLCLNKFYVLDNITISAVLVLGFILRMISYHFDWHLPKIKKLYDSGLRLFI